MSKVILEAGMNLSKMTGNERIGKEVTEVTSLNKSMKAEKLMIYVIKR